MSSGPYGGMPIALAGDDYEPIYVRLRGLSTSIGADEWGAPTLTVTDDMGTVVFGLGLADVGDGSLAGVHALAEATREFANAIEVYGTLAHRP